jgi:hypothetical protein
MPLTGIFGLSMNSQPHNSHVAFSSFSFSQGVIFLLKQFGHFRLAKKSSARQPISEAKVLIFSHNKKLAIILNLRLPKLNDCRACRRFKAAIVAL